jgi:hypothetical protein
MSCNFFQLCQNRPELKSHQGVSFFSGNLARAVPNRLAKTIVPKGLPVDRMICWRQHPASKPGRRSAVN